MATDIIGRNRFVWGFFLLVRIGLVVDVSKDFAVVVGELLVAASHHAFCNLEEFWQLHIGETSCRAFGERRHKVARESRAVDVYAHAEHSGGVEHAVDASLRVVAHKEAAELQSGAEESCGRVVPEFDFGIVVFEVRSRRSGADVAPFAYDSVAQESIVTLVAEANHHHIVEFAAHLAVRPQRGRTIDLGAHVDVSLFASRKRGPYAAALHDFGVSADVDRAFGDV